MNKERYLIRFSMKAEGDEAEVMIYSAIDSEKWWGDETTPADFDKALKEARKNGAAKLNVRINSPGGDVYSAVAMRSMIINAGFESVRVMIEGLCASAATLFATIPDASVVIAEGSEFMIHNPMTICRGNAAELEKTVDHLHKLESQFHGMYAAKTGQTEDQIKEWMDAETWFTAKEACDYGFCDEMLSAEPVAACVSTHEMAVMCGIYKAVPKGITIRQDDKPAAKEVSHEAPVAGASTEINQHEEENPTMDIKDINVDQLRAENPALLEQIQQAAIAAERQRQEDIDALTDPGYEELAAKAKAAGTSAMDFHKQLITAKKQKGTNFLNNRKEETSPAKDVAGGAPTDDKQTEQAEIEANAKEIAAYAKAYAGNDNEGMF